MRPFDLFTSLSEKLLNYEPLLRIYDKRNHYFPLKDIEMYSKFDQIDWAKILVNYQTVLKGLYVYIANDDYLNNSESYINDEIFDLHEEFLSFDIRNANDEQKELFLKTILLLNLYACCVVQQGNLDRLLSNGELDTKKSVNTMFRGEDNYSYSLMPSMYRDLKINELTVINFNELHSYYDSKKLISKYRLFCGNADVDYTFCSLMQHAGCKSPFLDVTSDIKVALSFACHTNQNTDGALYVFNAIQENKRNDMRNISVVITNRRFDLMTIIRRTPILFCDISKFDVSMTLLREQTNDRMIFQKGAFLYINRCIIVNNVLLLPITNKRIKKYRITKDMKNHFDTLFQQPENNRHYYDYLLNPYEYLKSK